MAEGTAISANSFMGRSADDAETLLALRSTQNTLQVTNIELGRVTSQMNVFNASLQRISGLIASESFLERQREAQKQEQERRLAEQQAREGQESLVERKIQSSLVTPVQKVQAKTQFALSNLMKVFTFLLGGWLLNQGVRAFKASSDRNIEKLKNIRDETLTGLGVIGTIFGIVRTGINNVLGTIFNITGNIGKAITDNIFKKPFEAIRNLLGLGSKTGGGGAAASLTDDALKGIRGFARGLLGPIGGGAALTALDIAANKEEPVRAAVGTVGGMVASTAAFSIGSFVPFPGTGLLAGGLAYNAGQDFTKGIYDKFFGKDKEEIKLPSFTIPQIPFLNKMDFKMPPVFGEITANIMGEKESPDKQKSVTADSTPAKPPSATPAQISAAPAQDVSSKVGPEPEQKTQVILTDATSSPDPQVVPAVGGEGNYVPSIPSSNPDNFYALYSQIHYNVVM